MVVSRIIHSVMLFPVMELRLEGPKLHQVAVQWGNKYKAFIHIMKWGFPILPELGIIYRS